MDPGPPRRTMRRIETSYDVRFLTFSTHQRMRVFGDPRNATIFAASLRNAVATHQFRLIAWVLMPDHAHLLLRTREGASTVPTILNSIKTPCARQIVKHWRTLDAIPADARDGVRIRIWETGGGFDRNIWSDREFEEKFSYIHTNPVRAGLTTRQVDWPWSSARWWSTERTLDCIPCVHAND